MLALGAPLAAQAGDASQSRIPTVTRLVQQFTAMENALATAASEKNAASLEAMLAADFEMRTGIAPAVPIPRNEWLRHTLAEKSKPPEAEQMAVHDLGSAAIVSFLGRRKVGGSLFIVDIWTRAGDDWKLSIRYVSPGASPRFDIPGNGK